MSKSLRDTASKKRKPSMPSKKRTNIKSSSKSPSTSAPPWESPEWQESVRQTPALKPFFDNLESFVELPKGVAKLRDLFLDLAVRGKLVQQDVNDESAEVVIDNARSQRKQLLKAKEISRRRVLEINNDDMPYQLPRG